MKLELHPSATVRFKLCDQCRSAPSKFVAWLMADVAYEKLHFCSAECGEAYEVHLALLLGADVTK